MWKSGDLTAGAALLGGVAALASQGGSLAHVVRTLATTLWSGAASVDVQTTQLPGLLGRAVVVVAVPLLSVLAIPWLCGAFAAFLQVRPLLTLDVLEPKFERLSPAANLGRIFGTQGLMELLKSIAKLVIVVVLCWWTVDGVLREVLRIGLSDVAGVGTMMRELAITLALRVGVVMLALGVLDTLFQRRQWMQRLRMTRTEYERSLKDQGQDAQTLRRRRQAREEMKQRAAVLRSVEQWDVLTLNPTHLACALRYDPSQEVAPRILARGRGALAQEMIRLARARGVPVIRKKSLTRALFQLKVGSQVPRPLHAAVKIVLEWVEEDVAKRGKAPRWAKEAASAAPARGV